ncbi:hypothetical protein [Spirosoma agri]|uniref:Uncharacterized protein n=1 Tax=Spirosoma agri TaxID=1987381 RepID=A0A6M0IK93_9BACT|nr:hypothetical protein [Spirosoma agri]NEU67801.1 hypothetical protein [Spirosoma agri]
MTDFEHIQALWKQQPNTNQPQSALAVIAKAETSSKRLLATHRGTLFVLSATVLLLAGYFWVYGTTANQTVLVASLLMIGSLLVRIAVEYVSYRRLAHLKLHTDLRTCLAQTRSFHRARQRIQLMLTPVSLSCYVVGFMMLLPYVKAGVSEGFYWYIVLSGSFFLLILCVIIYRQIRDEMRLLAQLEESYTTLLGD